jgi:hypothetical protein
VEHAISISIQSRYFMLVAQKTCRSPFSQYQLSGSFDPVFWQLHTKEIGCGMFSSMILAIVSIKSSVIWLLYWLNYKTHFGTSGEETADRHTCTCPSHSAITSCTLCIEHTRTAVFSCLFKCEGTRWSVCDSLSKNEKRIACPTVVRKPITGEAGQRRPIASV